MSELNDVLRRYMMESTIDDKIVLTREGLKNTEQAILAWHKAELERVIGEDTHNPDGDGLSRQAENQLRAEQRKRANI